MVSDSIYLKCSQFIGDNAATLPINTPYSRLGGDEIWAVDSQENL